MGTFDFELKEAVIKSKKSFGGIKESLVNAIWNTIEVKKKIAFAKKRFQFIKKNNRNFIYDIEEVESEMFIVFDNCLKNFDFSKETVFTSYLNSAIKNRLDAIENECNKDLTEAKSDYLSVNEPTVQFTTMDQSQILIDDLKRCGIKTNHIETFLTTLDPKQISKFKRIAKTKANKYDKI